MRRIAVLVCGLLLAGCSSGNGVDKPAPETAGEVTAEAAALETKHAALIDAYTTVLNNPGAYEFNKTDRFEPTGTYSYAIAEVTGDDQPDLLLKADARDYWAPVTVFSKPKDGELFNTREVLIWGAGSAGGGRANIATSPLGNGLFQITGQSIQREWEAELFVVKDHQLVPGNGKATVPATNLYSGGYREVEWTPSSDLGPLHQLGTSKPAAPKGEATAPIVSTCGMSADTAVFTGTDATSCEFARAVATAAAGKTGSFEVTATSPVTNQNYTMNCSGTDAETVCTGGNNASVVLRPAGPVELNSVYEQSFEGTVVLKRALEVANHLGVPNGEGPDNEYFILVLDTPQPATAMKAGPDRPVTNTVDSIGLAKKEFTPYGVIDNTAPWRLYENKRIRLHINTSSMRYQTDASLPWGKPRVDNFTADYQVEVLN
ncbi:hypothetical protein J5O04_10635 [Corynebacterium hindlerae]|uniref:hypothetical protein n=1 Tax=Corynebacterium hindlerae TaxID=699041 RepID=UPI001AD68A8F|nr:hypothetical protein [Corynebacterium hindlerae]QTH59249.1 hypothetical protein J5O04_10635 [Corynebacterium hindlerae]